MQFIIIDNTIGASNWLTLAQQGMGIIGNDMADSLIIKKTANGRQKYKT